MRLLTEIIELFFPSAPVFTERTKKEDIDLLLRNKPAPQQTPAPWITAGFHYQDPDVKRLVHYLKKYNNQQVTGALTRRAHDALAELESKHHLLHGGGPTVLVPIPLHRKQLRKRGYNQSELVARSLAANHAHRQVGLYLRCIRRTEKQALLSRSARYHNIAGSLHRSRKTLPRNALVVIVDDVTTTGATLLEARLQFASDVPPHRLVAITIAH